MSDQARFDFDGPEPRGESADARARRVAVDPTRHVALEASAGTGKTRVLVDRYVRLLEAGVPPRHILAITFTRKAAAEMRQRVLATLRQRRQDGSLSTARWREIRDAFADIAISTIDAFCLSLLREFPLEAGVDPGFTLADETETPRLLTSSLDRALRIGRGLALDDADVALVFTELGEGQLRSGLATLLDRRLVAWDALSRYLRGQDMTVERACSRLHRALQAALAAVPGVSPATSEAGAAALVRSGPEDPVFTLLARDIAEVLTGPEPAPARLRGALDRLAAHVLTQKGEPRKRLAHTKARFRTAADFERHKAIVFALAPQVVSIKDGFRHDLNLVLARGVRRLFAVAQEEFRRTLDKQGVLDFPDLLDRTLRLLGQMEEFSRSRYRLESRYEHVLVDEFQDTSRAQWRLVRELVRAWAAGEGATHGPLPPTIFIVGDRKQSIYAFRDAEVAVLDAAGRFIQALRPESVRAAITRSYRSVRPLLSFVNDVFATVEKIAGRPDAFRYDETDAFPLGETTEGDRDAIGVVAAPSDDAQADAVADEIARLLRDGVLVRDRQTGLHRPAEPGDIAILFRTREGHRLFESALARRGVPFYVYKGLGFFDADEVKDVLALIGYLANPASNLRAAALLRSRIVGLSDEGLKRLAPRLAEALVSDELPSTMTPLADEDAERLGLTREAVRGWIRLADQWPPAELVDRALSESAYAVETAGAGRSQARENLKKVRGLIRRVQNRGYATLERLAEFFDQLVAGGDESNAMIDAADAVNLMTIHAAKGLEFPVVFIVNLGKGSGGARDAIRIVAAPFAGEDEDEGEVSVAVGDHVTDADRDRDAQEQEETKRLLYVAMTRARDRLYLGATLGQGRLAMGRGALGKVLPPTLLQSVADAADPRLVEWRGPSEPHALQRVAAAAEGPITYKPIEIERRWSDDFAGFRPTGTGRVAAVALAAAERALAPPAGPSSARAGILAHTLIARALRRPQIDAATILREAAVLARAEGLSRAEDVDRLASEAARLCGRIIARSDVQALLASGTPVFEAAVSMPSPDGRVVRGSIDCLVIGPDRMTVLEFKTGARTVEHGRQLAVYEEAVRRLARGLPVDGHLVYADESP